MVTNQQLTNLGQEDLDAESTLHQQSSGSLITELHARYESEAIKEEIPAEEYRMMMQQLNKKVTYCNISPKLVQEDRYCSKKWVSNCSL